MRNAREVTSGVSIKATSIEEMNDEERRLCISASAIASVV